MQFFDNFSSNHCPSSSSPSLIKVCIAFLRGHTGKRGPRTPRVKLVPKEYIERATEESRNNMLHKKLQQTELYKSTKTQLAKMCSKLNLQTKGTKLRLTERLAKAKKLDLKEHATPLYAGD